VSGRKPERSPPALERDEWFVALAAELRAFFARGLGEARDDAFAALALRVFEYQAERNPAYGAFCRRRGRLPRTVDHWAEVPAVPTSAFKRLPLVSGDPGRVEATFRTSGTTLGAGGRGTHYVRDLSLYRASLLPNFEAHLAPEKSRLPVLSLVPSPGEASDSSLSHMVGVVMEHVGGEGSDYFTHPDRGLDWEGFTASARRRIDGDEPVLVLGTAFAFVHLLAALERAAVTLKLPAGSRVMETGGFKGRSREMPRPELYGALTRTLGVEERWIINEYGMTELLSQFYDGVAGHAASVAKDEVGTGERAHRPPPWVRTRVLNPTTLEPSPVGEPGIMMHFDLANLGTVSAILTEDLGVQSGDGFVLLGRAADAEPRGCSIAMDDLLAVADG
jgi:hypothetical protein